MNETNHGGADELLTRVSSSLTRWVLGIGLLSLHATTYTVAMVAMVLWNIYDSPNDLWVDEVFYRWTAVLAFHAIAVACGWAAYRLMRSEQAAVMAAQREWTPVQTSPASAMQPYQLQAPTQVWQPVNQSQDIGGSRRGEDAAKRALSSSAAWSTAFARRTVGAMSGVSNRLSHRNGAGARDVEPAQTWPEAPSRATSDDAEFVTRFTAPIQPPVEPTPPSPEPKNESDTVLKVTNIAEPELDQPAPPPAKGPGQSWVQAATSAWHGPNDGADVRPNGRQDDDANGSSPV